MFPWEVPFKVEVMRLADLKVARLLSDAQEARRLAVEARDHDARMLADLKEARKASFWRSGIYDRGRTEIRSNTYAARGRVH